MIELNLDDVAEWLRRIRRTSQQCRYGHDFLNFGAVPRRATTFGPIARGEGGTTIGQVIGRVEARSYALKAQEVTLRRVLFMALMDGWSISSA